MTRRTQVSNRMLERARLGELDDQEVAELMEQLELEGGTERLDEALQADQEFLEKYPVTFMVPQIRNRLERQLRERERQTQTPIEGKDMLSNKTLLWHPFTAAAIAAIVAALVVLGMERPWEDTPPPIAENAEAGEDVHQRTTAPAAGPTRVFAERIDRRLSPLNELVLTPGEELIFSAANVARVEVDQTQVIRPPRLTDDQSKFVLRAANIGLSRVRLVHHGDQETDLFYARVLPWHQTSFADGTASVADRDKVVACDDLALDRNLKGTITARLIIAPSGSVAQAWIESSDIADQDLEACVERVSQTVRHAEVGHATTALVEYTFPVTAPGH